MANVRQALNMEVDLYRGYSAYETAVQNGFTGTEEQWIASLKGDQGDSGATFTPSVDADGNLSWTNDKEMENPSPTNIKGPPGNPGNPGTPGDTGPGVPAGGTVGQVLQKAGATDFDTEWTDLPPWVLSIDTTTGKLTLTYTGATI